MGCVAGFWFLSPENLKPLGFTKQAYACEVPPVYIIHYIF